MLYKLGAAAHLHLFEWHGLSEAQEQQSSLRIWSGAESFKGGSVTG